MIHQSRIHVTITGADDAVDPENLVLLSRRFPFIEWGILASSSRMGTPRYPTLNWIRGRLLPRRDLRCALHLCGKWANECFELKAFRKGFPAFDYDSFGRIQLNGWDNQQASTALMGAERPELILQCRDGARLDATIWTARKLGRASVLFDASGGEGIRPPSWPVPEPFHAGRWEMPLGFAGGIGPDNVTDVLDEICKLALTRRWFQPFWIDMETGVRTNDALDLEKVREVLERVRLVNARFNIEAEQEMARCYG